MAGFAHIEVRPNGDVVLVDTAIGVGGGGGTGGGSGTVDESDISLYDVTTDNATTGRHGFLRKLSGNAAQYLDGSGNWTVPSFSISTITEAQISLSDVTTDNVSNIKHGFAPKSPGDITKFLNGATNPDYAQVKDSDLSTSDITTNDASTSKHGFLKKLSGVSGTWLNGMGQWAALSGITEAELQFSDVTTNDSTTSRHGLLKKLSGNATDYMDGSGNWSVPAGGGGGGSVSEANIVLSDVTTDDSTSSRHGFLPKLSGLTGTWLNGQGQWLALSGITEAQLALTDVTIADVSITKHGFAPKAPNDTTKFLRGDATWAVPSGGSSIGSSVLIYRYTVTGSDKTSIDTGVDTADAGSNDWTNCDLLEIIVNARTDEAVFGSNINLTFNNDTGSVYDFQWERINQTTSAYVSSQANAKIQFQVPGTSVTNTTIFGISEMKVPNPTGTVASKELSGTWGYSTPNNTGNPTVAPFIGTYYPASPAALTRLAITPATSGKKFKVGTVITIYKRLAS